MQQRDLDVGPFDEQARRPWPRSPITEPSQVTWARVSGRSDSRSSIGLPAGTTIGRSLRVCGEIGASTQTSRFGSTMGPPQERAYAVDPVAVATTMPSPLWEFTNRPLM